MKNKSMIFEIIKKEIRDVIRDKKTLVTMIIIPLLLCPVLLGGMLILEESMLNIEESEYNTVGFAFETDDTFNTIIEELGIEKLQGNEEELRTKLENQEIDSYITLENNEFTVHYASKGMNGYASLELSMNLIGAYIQSIQSQMLTSEGLIPEEIFNIYTMQENDISDRDLYSEMMLNMIPTFIIMLTTTTAVFSAIDMTAGEKERGTLETLLTFPIKNSDIITGKFIATTICSIITSVIGFSSMYAVLYYLSGKLETFQGMELLTTRSIILALIIFVVFSMLISALAIVVASKAKSFKEGQNSAQTLTVFSVVPMFFSMIGIELNVVFSLIPFVNVNLLISQIMSNEVNMQYFILSIISSVIVIYVALKAISKLYKSDKILFS